MADRVESVRGTFVIYTAYHHVEPIAASLPLYIDFHRPSSPSLSFWVFWKLTRYTTDGPSPLSWSAFPLSYPLWFPILHPLDR